MPPESRTTDTPSARDRILRTAHDLFYRDGVRATGIDRVIAESGVAKVTFYRHFPSKNDLIRAYLDHRHQRWMAWFADALARHGGGPKAIVPAVGEWLRDPGYRGCAFINSLAELAGALPEVVDIARAHKADVAAAIATVLPDSRDRAELAQAIALAIDGGIVRAQFEPTPDAALDGLTRIVDALLTA
jgi:AcrR family transcriptional regulator